MSGVPGPQRVMEQSCTLWWATVISSDRASRLRLASEGSRRPPPLCLGPQVSTTTVSPRESNLGHHNDRWMVTCSRGL
jgi:hypothetical protein